MSRFSRIGILSASIILLCLGAGCASHRPEAPLSAPRPGTFLSASGLPADEAAVAETLRHADYILIGEVHDVPLHHAVQAGVMELLARESRRPLLGLEMVGADRQKILDRFNRQGMELDDLPPALDWENSWGFDFSLYRPIFETARKRGIPVYALNVPRRVFEAARGKDARFAPAERRWMPSRIIPPQRAQEAFLYKVFSMHRSMRPGGSDPAPGRTAERMEGLTTKPTAQPAPPAQAAFAADPGRDPAFVRFMRMQSLWDSAMAERAASLRKRSRRPVIILAGGGHVEYGYGIAHRLRIFDPQARIALVMPFAGGVAPTAPVDSLWNAAAVSAPPPNTAERGTVRPPDTLFAPPADILFYSPPRLRSRLGMTLAEREGCVLVTGVEPGSRAARAGVREGQRIVRLGNVPITGLFDMHRAAVSSGGKPPANVTVEENGLENTLSLEAPEK